MSINAAVEIGWLPLDSAEVYDPLLQNAEVQYLSDNSQGQRNSSILNGNMEAESRNRWEGEVEKVIKKNLKEIKVWFSFCQDYTVNEKNMSTR